MSATKDSRLDAASHKTSTPTSTAHAEPGLLNIKHKELSPMGCERQTRQDHLLVTDQIYQGIEANSKAAELAAVVMSEQNIVGITVAAISAAVLSRDVADIQTQPAKTAELQGIVAHSVVRGATELPPPTSHDPAMQPESLKVSNSHKDKQLTVSEDKLTRHDLHNSHLLLVAKGTPTTSSIYDNQHATRTDLLSNRLCLAERQGTPVPHITLDPPIVPSDKPPDYQTVHMATYATSRTYC